VLSKKINEKEELITKLKSSYDSSSNAKAPSNNIADLEKLLTETPSGPSARSSGPSVPVVKNDVNTVLQSQRDHYRERLEEVCVPIFSYVFILVHLCVSMCMYIYLIIPTYIPICICICMYIYIYIM